MTFLIYFHTIVLQLKLQKASFSDINECSLICWSESVCENVF